MLLNCVRKLRLTPSLVRHVSKSIENPVTVNLTRVEKSLNQVVLLGRVGTEPVQRGNEEHPVTMFTMATHTNYKYHTGETHQKTEWHRVSVFKPFLRDSVYKYLSKGQRCLVQGKIMYGQVTDAGGTAHTTTTIAADDVIFFNKADLSHAQMEEEEEDTFA